MTKIYLKKMIEKHDRSNQILLIMALLFGVCIGRYFFYDNYRNILSGFILGTVGVIVLLLIEKNIRVKRNYEKGLKLEDMIVGQLKSIGYTCEQSIQTGRGDLDLLAVKNGRYYGIEAKNISGSIIYSKENLQHGRYSLNKSLDRLLSNCQFVRNKKYGSDSTVFIKPVVVFGYDTNLLGIPTEGILYKGNMIKIFSIKDINKELS